MTEKYIKLDDILALIEKCRWQMNLSHYFGVNLNVVVTDEFLGYLRQLPTIDVEEGGIRRKNSAFLSVEPPEDKVYILNDKGAVMMNFATFEMVLNGEITFSTINTRLKFERDKFEREENAAKAEKRTPISPPTLQCNDCTRYFYCAMDERDSEDCPRYKPREPEKEEAEE